MRNPPAAQDAAPAGNDVAPAGAQAGGDLSAFFDQWFRRGGAPVVDVDWWSTPRGDSVEVSLSQRQSGEPFTFRLDVAIDCAGDTTILRSFDVDGAREGFAVATPSRALSLRIDPDRRLLLWRPEYGPRPEP
jgi:aminopeptidase N